MRWSDDASGAAACAAVLTLALSGCVSDNVNRGPANDGAAARRTGDPATAGAHGTSRSTPPPVVGPAVPSPGSMPSGDVPGGLTPRELGSFSPSEGRVLSCSDDATRLPDRTVVYCPEGCRGRRSVWGTRIYTDDSGVCVAALHDGVIDEGGGYAVVVLRPGQGSYVGSPAHGVVSLSYGEHPSSFEVFGVAGVETFPLRLSCFQDGSTVLKTFPSQAVLSCSQPCARSAVYGDGYYTVDSSVCGAAQHSGVPLEQFVIRAAGPRSGFEGRWRNGIRSSSWSTSWQAFTVHPWVPR